MNVFHMPYSLDSGTFCWAQALSSAIARVWPHLKFNCKSLAYHCGVCFTPVQFHLTECINSMVLESQLPHKIVNLLFLLEEQ